VKDLTDRLLRTAAEMDNIRKRTERDKADTIKYAITKFAGDIVTVGDNFQRAISAVPPGAADADPALKSLVEGVTLTEREFHGVLERHGVKRLDPKGQSFDPNFHQAVMEQDNKEVPAGTVLNVFQAGYVIEDRILRPAMVVVSKGGFKPMKPAEVKPDKDDDDHSDEVPEIM
jgi:molecular chaperone GrpE